MYLKIGDIDYEVIIIKKRINHTYIRIKEDFKIYVSTPKWFSDKEVKKILIHESAKIKKMILRRKKRVDERNLILGKEVDIVVVSNLKYPELDNGKFYIKDRQKIDDYLKIIAFDIYKQRLDYLFKQFDEMIPYPTLKIRKMKTRWGVCNRKNKSITINLELIRKELKYIDYVIIHELCHFIHFDHSSSFWDLVSKYVKEYKEIRKELRY